MIRFVFGLPEGSPRGVCLFFVPTRRMEVLREAVDLLVNRKVPESYRLADGTMLFGCPDVSILGGESAESRP